MDQVNEIESAVAQWLKSLGVEGQKSLKKKGWPERVWMFQHSEIFYSSRLGRSMSAQEIQTHMERCMRPGRVRVRANPSGVKYTGPDLVGRRFGRLLVLSRVMAKTGHQRRSMWECECSCGNKKSVRTNELLNGDTTSCGCYAREVNQARSTKKITFHPRWDLSSIPDEALGKEISRRAGRVRFQTWLRCASGCPGGRLIGRALPLQFTAQHGECLA